MTTLVVSVAYSEEKNLFPSRKVSEVMPALLQFEPNSHSRQKILGQLSVLLGKPDRHVIHSLSKIDNSFCYDMDDKSMIDASFSKNELVSLTLRKSDGDIRFLYYNPKF